LVGITVGKNKMILVMTLSDITPTSQHKLKSLEQRESSQSANYARVVKYLNEIQERSNPARKTMARFNILFIVILVITSIAVVVMSEW
jgi:hypothetical protein